MILILKHKQAETLLILAGFLICSHALSHGGGLDASGCHTESATNTYHCHGGGDADPNTNDLKFTIGHLANISAMSYFLITPLGDTQYFWENNMLGLGFLGVSSGVNGSLDDGWSYFFRGKLSSVYESSMTGGFGYAVTPNANLYAGLGYHVSVQDFEVEENGEIVEIYGHVGLTPELSFLYALNPESKLGLTIDFDLQNVWLDYQFSFR